MTTTPVDLVRERLVAVTGYPGRGSNWCCPAHDDRSPSLVVNEGDQGGVVLTCHAGCSTEDVLKALDLTWADVCPPRPTAPTHHPRPVVAARYPYTDEAGELLYHVVRWEPGFDGKRRSFEQKPANGRSGTGAMNGVRRVLYRLPEVIAAVEQGRTVYVVEGEKDADALRALYAPGTGPAATCNPAGAGKWNTVEHLARAVLVGANVVIVADRDDAGRAHAAAVARSLVDVAATVRVVEAASGKDLADHLAAGHVLAELVPADPGAAAGGTVPDGQLAQHDADQAADDADVGLVGQKLAWLRANVYSGFGLDVLPPATWIVEPVLTTDALAIAFGASGARKSFVMLDLAAHIATNRERWHGCPVRLAGPVLYVTAEPAGFADRVHAWATFHNGGAEPGRLHIIPMAIELHDLVATAPAVGHLAVELGAVLVIIDTLARNTAGLNDSDNKDMAVAVAGMDTVRQVSGASVAVVHHAGHGDLKRMRGASALYAAADTVLAIGRNGDAVTVTTQADSGGKQRSASDDWTITLASDVVPVDGGRSTLVLTNRTPRLAAEAPAEYLATLAALEAIAVPPMGATTAEWLVSRDIPKSTFMRHRKTLIELGLVSLIGETTKTPRHLPKRADP